MEEQDRRRYVFVDGVYQFVVTSTGSVARVRLDKRGTGAYAGAEHATVRHIRKWLEDHPGVEILDVR